MTNDERTTVDIDAQRLAIDTFNQWSWPHENDFERDARMYQTYVAEHMLVALVPDVQFFALDLNGPGGWSLFPVPGRTQTQVQMLAFSPSVPGTRPLREHLEAYVGYLQVVYRREGGYPAVVTTEPLPDEVTAS